MIVLGALLAVFGTPLPLIYAGMPAWVYGLEVACGCAVLYAWARPRVTGEEW